MPANLSEPPKDSRTKPIFGGTAGSGNKNLLAPRLFAPAKVVAAILSGDRLIFWLCLASFLTAMAACLLQDFSRSALESAWVFDSGHYLQSSQKLAQVGRQLAQHIDGKAVLSACQQLKDLLLPDGPVLPALGALIAILISKNAVTDCRAIIFMQCCLHATSAVLVCLLTKRLSRSNLAAATSSLIWAVYPPAVLAAGKFLSETLATVLLLSLVLSTSTLFGQGSSSTRSGFNRLLTTGWLSGMVTGLLMLVKPALSWPAVAIDLMCLSRMAAKKRLLAAACLSAGLLLPVAPWAVYTKVVTGKFSVTNQRLATFNVVTGLDLETDGWGALLETPFVAMFPHNEDTLPAALGIWQHNPVQSINLMLRKLSRLWSEPWNDFRSSFMRLPVAPQVWWHQFLLFMALVGFLAFHSSQLKRSAWRSLSFSEEQIAREKAASFAGWAATIVLAGHLTYLLVVANSRYAFTAMPFILCFAGYAVATINGAGLRRLVMAYLAAAALCLIPFLQMDLLPFLSLLELPLNQARLLEAAIKVVSECAAFAAIFCAIRLCQPGRSISLAGKLCLIALFLLIAGTNYGFASTDATLSEWSCKLASGAAAERTVKLDVSTSRQPEWAMIVVDGDAASGQGIICVNGHMLAQKPRPLYLYAGDRNYLGAFQIYSSLLKTPSSKMRQWRAVSVPIGLLNLNGQNKLAISPAHSGSLTIFGNFNSVGDKLRMPSLTLNSPTKLLSSNNNLDLRLVEPREIGDRQAVSLYHEPSGKTASDLSPALGRQIGQYHMLLLLGFPKAGSSDYTSYGPNKPVEPLSVALTSNEKKFGVLGQSFSADLPQSLTSRTQLNVLLTGEIRCLEGQAATIVAIAFKGSKSVDSYFLENTPAPRPATSKWAPLKISGQFPCSLLPAGKRTLFVSLTSNRNDVVVRNMRLRIESADGPDFTGHAVKVFETRRDSYISILAWQNRVRA
jgi:hypothetical protein